jgi:hypothetical protein
MKTLVKHFKQTLFELFVVAVGVSAIVGPFALFWNPTN